MIIRHFCPQIDWKIFPNELEFKSNPALWALSNIALDCTIESNFLTEYIHNYILEITLKQKEWNLFKVCFMTTINFNLPS
jgi:hypothetical protein